MHFRNQLLHLVLLICWMGVIAFLSGDIGSKDTMIGILPSFLRRFFLAPDGSSDQSLLATGAIWVIRKLAHLTAYAILAILAFRWLSSWQKSVRVAQYGAIIFCVLYAILDETHQSIVPSRSGTPIDVGIDMLGAVVGMAVYRRRKARE